MCIMYIATSYGYTEKKKQRKTRLALCVYVYQYNIPHCGVAQCHAKPCNAMNVL